MSGISKFSPQERFYMKADRPSFKECWFWTGARDGDGYGGYVRWHSRRFKAHRVSWMIAHRTDDIPAGMDIMHSCDNPSCVNPRHLSLGTRADNIQDAKNKGRLGGPRPSTRKKFCGRGHARVPENLTKRGQCRKCANMLHTEYKKRARNRKTAVRRLSAFLPMMPLFAQGLDADERGVVGFDGDVVMGEATEDE